MRTSLVYVGVFLLSLGPCVAMEDLDRNSTDKFQPESVIERSSHHHHESPTFNGFWKKSFIWRPRWVKTWQEKKVYVAVWKRMWSPAQVKEWVPVPKPPPGWVKHNGVPFIKIGA